jgi:hypothetical protein
VYAVPPKAAASVINASFKVSSVDLAPATYYGGSWLSAKMGWRYTLAEILAIGVAFPLAFFLLMYGVVRIVELIAKLRKTGQL